MWSLRCSSHSPAPWSTGTRKVGAAVYATLSSAVRRLVFGERTLAQAIGQPENNFTALRVLLACLVILYHAPYLMGSSVADWITRHLLAPSILLGQLAVELFFFLSGLFVAQSLFYDPAFLPFMIKRVARIFPGLMVCLLLTVLLASVVSKGALFWQTFLLPETYLYLLGNTAMSWHWTLPDLFAHNPLPELNGSIHTLKTEFKMYLGLGMVALLRLAGSRLSLGVIALALLALIFVDPWVLEQAIQIRPDALIMVEMFAIGMLVFAGAHMIRVSALMGLLLGLALAAPVPLPMHTALIYAFCVWLVLFIGQSQRLRRVLPLRTDPSYGIYIYGWPCQQCVIGVLPNASMGFCTCLALALAVLLGMVSYWMVEQPGMAFGRALILSWRQRHGLRLGRLFMTGGERALVSILIVCWLFWMPLLPLLTRYNLLATEPMEAQIVSFGPQQARAGESFNPGPDGQSRLWLMLSEPPPRNAEIVFDQHILATVAEDQSKVVTAEVPNRLLRSSGALQIYVRAVNQGRIARSNPVTLRLQR